MIELAELKKFARAASEIVRRDREIAQFEIYCASREHRIARLNYTSEIPSRGVEEFKSLDADGFQIRVAMRRDPHENGFAFDAADLNLDAVRSVLARAHRATVVDPHFPGYPGPSAAIARSANFKSASDLARASDRQLAAAAWATIRGALTAFARSGAAPESEPGLVIGGDISILSDRIAIAGSNFDGVRGDEGAHFSSSVTALVESLGAKGTAFAIGRSRAEMQRAAVSLGRDSVSRALTLKHGARPASGKYRVMLGPQPIAEILNYMVMGSLTTGAFHAASSAYHARFGAQVMDERLSLFDDPAMRRGAVNRSITCEGLPARRVDLIRKGKLVGLLSNFYDSHRLASDEDRAGKLGPRADPDTTFAPSSGYRLGEGGGRRFDAHPGSAGTNVVMRPRRGVPDRELTRAVGDGIYVGRVWYTYPINGQRAGDFTCTVTGDSYLIRDGKIGQPLAPNCLRINANIAQIFDAPVAAGSKLSPAVVWGSPEAYYVPSLVADGISLAAIGLG
ncbi:MAG TPA: metallopeptidase TldD-related protein [Candidatus Binataceae bacterium]